MDIAMEKQIPQLCGQKRDRKSDDSNEATWQSTPKWVKTTETTEPAPEIPIEEGQEKKVDPHQEVTHFAQFRSELAEV